METFCRECGKSINPVEGKRKKEFCDSTCRSNHWQKKKRLLQKTVQINHVPEIVPTSKENIEKFNKTFEEIGRAKIIPKTLDELKSLCPPELTGLDKSAWIANERQKYGI